MFNFDPENIQGDTNKLLYSILLELRQLNKPLHPIAKDTVVTRKPKPKPRVKAKSKPIPKLEKQTELIGGA